MAGTIGIGLEGYLCRAATVDADRRQDRLALRKTLFGTGTVTFLTPVLSALFSLSAGLNGARYAEQNSLIAVTI